jgi:catechol 2,3-dioxygenase-like lactoylglutathione lyase family enzyme
MPLPGGTAMLSQQKLVGFAPISDAARARSFYVDVLGLEFVTEDGFAVVVRSRANTIRLVLVEKVTPAFGTTLGWEVSDLAGEVRALAERGVVFERFEGMGQDELGIWYPSGTPGDGGVAWFKDPDGNLLSLSGKQGAGTGSAAGVEIES